MLSEKRIQELILESLASVKESEPIYGDLTLNDATILLGSGSPFDSIAFTAFATGLEEKIEDETGEEYVLKVDEIFSAQDAQKGLSVRQLAPRISKLLGQGARKK